MENRIAFILNYAPHYRLFIFKRIGEVLEADFYFGNLKKSSVKKFDYNSLPTFKKEFLTTEILSLSWYHSCWRLIFLNYDNYVLTGDPKILSNWLFLILARLCGKKTFLWTHGWYGRESGVKKLIKKLFFSLSNKIFLYNDYAKKLMIEEGFRKDKLISLYNSLDYEKQLLIRNQLKQSRIYIDHFKNENPVLIYIGRIQKSKRIDLVLLALKKIKELGIIYNFVIVGERSEAIGIESEIDGLGLSEQVWLYGESYDEEVNARLLYNANLCVSPGNVGLTAVHSLMYGVPVLTHDNYVRQGPEFECIEEGVSGQFFRENDLDDLIEKISYCLSRQFSREDCMKVVDEKWNPNNQLLILTEALS